MHEHDHRYRLLFARPQMIEALVREFVPEPWVESLDFSTLERVNASYVSEKLKRSEGDMVWKLRRRDRTPVYLYLLVEFQSRPDRFMAVRIMAYVAALYLDLIARGELAPGRRLPLVIPLVAYNGVRRWRSPLELSELIERFDPAAEAYVPRLRYRVIDEGAYPPEELARRDGLAALLFWLKTQQGKAMVQAPRRLKELLAREGDSSMYRAFLIWLGYDPEAVPEFLSLKEFSEMWDTTVERWKRELQEVWREEMLQELREKGRKEGERQGEVKLLVRLLERKFGPLDRPTRARISKASSDRLLEWSDRILTAERLEEVFES
jgi:predicted transposase/invertase (TIGR01784 family)